MLIDIRIPVKDLKHLSTSCILGKMSSVALLPQELSGSQEWSWVLELPSTRVRERNKLIKRRRQYLPDDRVPLVKTKRKVSGRIELDSIAARGVW